MEMLVTIMYLICMFYIFLFSMSQLYLTWLYIRSKRNPLKFGNKQSGFSSRDNGTATYI